MHKNLDDLEKAHLETLAHDEDFWDFMDILEHNSGGAREWDNPQGEQELNGVLAFQGVQ